MASLTDLLQHGAAYGWLFIPTAILLGVLHGLEPGHSKTMMAAFIVAVHGTVRQAVLLGVAATVSHTAVIWLVALIGLSLGQQHGMATNEPYFQLASAALILVIGVWMLMRIRHERHHHHSHEDAHARAHAEEISEKFHGRHDVTTGQIIMFGLTGGLIPCPAAVTVLLVCLQLQHFALGMALVLCFSIGLALTLVASGVIAALSVRIAVRRFTWLPALIHNAPYLAGCITFAVGIYIGFEALSQLSH